MIITVIIKVLGGYSHIDAKHEIECKGSGTESDPAIIEPSENLPGAFRLEESNVFITIKDCYLDKLVLNSCQNVRIENCNTWSLAILECSKIFVNKSTIRRTLHLTECNNVKIDDCTIKRLKIRLSTLNTIKNSTIKKIKFITGYENTLEANNISEKHLKRLKKKYWYDWYKLKLI